MTYILLLFTIFLAQSIIYSGELNNNSIEFVTFKEYPTNTSVKSLIFLEYPKLLIADTAFPFRPIPINTHTHVARIEENTYYVCDTTKNQVVISGPNSPCVTILATHADDNRIVALHKYFFTQTHNCSSIIYNTFGQYTNKVKILLYAITLDNNLYNNRPLDGSRSWLEMHNNLRQKEYMLGIAETFNYVLGIPKENITIKLLKHSKNKIKFYLYSLLIDPQQKNIINFWGAYNTNINEPLIKNLITKKDIIRFDGSIYYRSVGTFADHFHTIANESQLIATSFYQNRVTQYNSLPLLKNITINCGLCMQCLDCNRS